MAEVQPFPALATLVCPCKKAHPLSDPTAGGTLCGADTKQVEAKYPTCHRPAGWGTPGGALPGKKCKLHGGSSLVKHGRYSMLSHERVRTLIEQHATDPDPLNIRPELDAARALFTDFINRYEEFTDALLDWHASYEAMRTPLPEEKVMAFEHVVDEWEIALRESATEPTERQLADVASARAFITLLRGGGPLTGKPRVVLDISDAYRIVSEITKIVERIEKIRAANAISRADMNRLIDQMGRAVLRHVTDKDTLRAIREDWLDLAF